VKIGKKNSGQHGFTLVELTVVMAVLTLLAALTTPSIRDELNRRRGDLTVQETQTLLDAARSYRSQKGVWPGNATCSNAISVLTNTSPAMLVGISTLNKYNSPVTTSCTSQTFSVDQNIVEDWDGYVANSLPGTTIVSVGSSLIRSTIGIPGSEPALDGKLSRVATGNAELNRMRTTLLMGNNDITEVRQILAQSIEASGGIEAGSLISKGTSQFEGKATFNDLIIMKKVAVEGAACATVGAIARDSSGAILTCQSGAWRKGGGVLAHDDGNIGGNYTFTISQPGVLVITGSAHRVTTSADVMITITVNGTVCGRDRDSFVRRENLYASTACTKQLSAGSHRVGIYASDTSESLPSTTVTNWGYVVYPM